MNSRRKGKHEQAFDSMRSLDDQLDRVYSVTFSVARPSDIPYILNLEKKNKESVGFLPSPAFRERQSVGRLFIGRINGSPFGYFMYDMKCREVNILQACIQYDARRRMYGAAFYNWCLSIWNADFVRLRCAADLEANLFWRAMGLVCVAVQDGGRRRGRKINVWHHYLLPQLIVAEETPAFQLREDCMDAQTGFLQHAPHGFNDLGKLGRLAWRQYK